MAEALENSDIEMLEVFLKDRFELASRGEYVWIAELDDVGYTTAELAKLLLTHRGLFSSQPQSSAGFPRSSLDSILLDRSLSFLEYLWGVRVSFCTGVAQRVPLTQLVADLLPAFADNDSEQISGARWAWLMSEYDINSQFESKDRLIEWLDKLSCNTRKFVLGLVYRVLEDQRHGYQFRRQALPSCISSERVYQPVSTFLSSKEPKQMDPYACRLGGLCNICIHIE